MISKEIFEAAGLLEKLLKSISWNDRTENDIKLLSLKIYKEAFVWAEKEYVDPALDPFTMMENPDLLYYPGILKNINEIIANVVKELRGYNRDISSTELINAIQMLIDNAVKQLNAI